MTNGVTEVPTKGRNEMAGYACANCPSHKDEDFHAHAASSDGNFECYVVLDGHGGSHAAVLVQEYMMKRAVEMYNVSKTFSESDIFTLFTESADKAASAKDLSGTTCTCVFMQRDLSTGNISLHMSWVGDSRGIICQSKKLIMETIDHNLKNPEEKARVLEATNNSVMVLTPQIGPNAETPSTPPYLDLDGSPPDPPGTNKRKEKDVELREGESEDVTTKGGGVYKSIMKGKAPSNQKPDPVDARRGSFIAQRITSSGEQRGPWCLFSGENGTSLAVTRSLGDADAARCCIKTPGIKKLTIKSGDFSRICICSDGVWDVLSSLQVAKRISGVTSGVTAARKIALITKERRYNTGAGKDDITVFVVDVFKPEVPVGCNVGCNVM
ncbi:hypothetical protein TL16_g12888 [Triparma laevis f. inornata]|uniref:PPM-type phosphatase domain-containing protein n=1 Tax=Triparma laevis f. inornata TaxID=1714386 RepID=A0A9W7BV94_9STRA|nr:hypothetical protein TL16_g12888 [Triparma laevis f. inornata]